MVMPEVIKSYFASPLYVLSLAVSGALKARYPEISADWKYVPETAS